MQTQTLFSLLQNFLRGIQICHMKADVLAIPKCGGFLGYNFINPSYCYSKSGQISGFFLAKWRCPKKRHGYIFLFRASILNKRGPNSRGWAETKPKVWFRSRNFGFWIKLSVSVDFGFCKTARFWRQTDKTAKKKAERIFFLHLF